MNKSKKILILSLILLVLPISGQANSNLTEIKGGLYMVSIALTGLSSNPTTRQHQLSLISLELNRLTLDLNSIIQGRVLGVSTSSSSFSSSNSDSRGYSRRPLAEVEISPGTRNSSRVIAGGSHRNIFSFKVEPEFSDIWMQYVEVTFDKEPWRYLDKISLVSGSKVLFSLNDLKEDDFSEIGNGDAYAIRFSGFFYKIKEGRKRTFKVRVEGKEFRGRDGIEIQVYLRNRSVGFVDEVDFTQRVPYNSAGERSRLSSTFTVERK